jgi:hypothetical protein
VRQNDRIHRSEIDMTLKFRERVGPQVKDDPCRTTFDEKPAATLPGIFAGRATSEDRQSHCTHVSSPSSRCDRSGALP